MRPSFCTGLLIGLLLTGGLAHSQGVGIGTTAPSNAAILELKSANQGLLLPRIVDTTRISKPEAGLLVFSLSDNTLYLYTGANWMRLAFNTSVTFTYNGATVTYGSLVSPTTGRSWLDRNLGALQVATSSTDYQGYGDLFQWGRPADGHQLITWTSSTSGVPIYVSFNSLSASNVPGFPWFIQSNGDWKMNKDDSLWQGADGVNNPCPAGWHVPTDLEWSNEIAYSSAGNAPTGGFSESNSAYNLLKLPIAGQRFGFSSGLLDTGLNGYYWSATVPSAGATNGMEFGGSFVVLIPFIRADGFPVRCIK